MKAKLHIRRHLVKGEVIWCLYMGRRANTPPLAVSWTFAGICQEARQWHSWLRLSLAFSLGVAL